MTTTHFQGNFEHPQHISAGAILLNERGEVCCHHLFTKNLKGYWADEEIDDFYLLMRETIQHDESLEEALHRGLMEEFGATGELVDYVGSIKSSFKHKGVEVERTTLFFLCKLKTLDAARRSDHDIEGKSVIEWQTPEYLIPRMKEQSVKYGRTDIDESSILERVRERIVNI